MSWFPIQFARGPLGYRLVLNRWLKRDNLFFLMCALCCRAIYADDRIHGSETEHVEDFIRQCWGPAPDERRRALATIRECRQLKTPLAKLADEFAVQCRYRRSVLIAMLDVLVGICCADRSVPPQEQELLATVTEVFRLPPEILLQLQAAHRPAAAETQTDRFREHSANHSNEYAGKHTGSEQDHGNAKLESCYVVLGCRSSDSLVVLKRKYRELAKESHPDRVLRDGAPPELVQRATARFREIQEAYEYIKLARGDR